MTKERVKERSNLHKKLLLLLCMMMAWSPFLLLTLIFFFCSFFTCKYRHIKKDLFGRGAVMHANLFTCCCDCTHLFAGEDEHWIFDSVWLWFCCRVTMRRIERIHAWLALATGPDRLKDEHNDDDDDAHLNLFDMTIISQGHLFSSSSSSKFKYTYHHHHTITSSYSEIQHVLLVKLYRKHCCWAYKHTICNLIPFSFPSPPVALAKEGKKISISLSLILWHEYIKCGQACTQWHL